MSRASRFAQLDTDYDRDLLIRKAGAQGVYPFILIRAMDHEGVLSDEQLDPWGLHDMYKWPEEGFRSAIEGMKRVGLLVRIDDEGFGLHGWELRGWLNRYRNGIRAMSGTQRSRKSRTDATDATDATANDAATTIVEESRVEESSLASPNGDGPAMPDQRAEPGKTCASCADCLECHADAGDPACGKWVDRKWATDATTSTTTATARGRGAGRAEEAWPRICEVWAESFGRPATEGRRADTVLRMKNAVRTCLNRKGMELDTILDVIREASTDDWYERTGNSGIEKLLRPARFDKLCDAIEGKAHRPPRRREAPLPAAATIQRQWDGVQGTTQDEDGEEGEGNGHFEF